MIRQEDASVSASPAPLLMTQQDTTIQALRMELEHYRHQVEQYQIVNKRLQEELAIARAQIMAFQVATASIPSPMMQVYSSALSPNPDPKASSNPSSPAPRVAEKLARPIPSSASVSLAKRIPPAPAFEQDKQPSGLEAGQEKESFSRISTGVL